MDFVLDPTVPACRDRHVLDGMQPTVTIDQWDVKGGRCTMKTATKNPREAGFTAAVGGGGRNRTGVDGFAGRCMTTLPPRQERRGLASRARQTKRESLALLRQGAPALTATGNTL